MKYLEAVKLISRIILASIITIYGIINIDNNDGLILLGISAILVNMESK